MKVEFAWRIIKAETHAKNLTRHDVTYTYVSYFVWKLLPVFQALCLHRGSILCIMYYVLEIPTAVLRITTYAFVRIISVFIIPGLSNSCLNFIDFWKTISTRNLTKSNTLKNRVFFCRKVLSSLLTYNKIFNLSFDETFLALRRRWSQGINKNKPTGQFLINYATCLFGDFYHRDVNCKWLHRTFQKSSFGGHQNHLCEHWRHVFCLFCF